MAVDTVVLEGPGALERPRVLEMPGALKGPGEGPGVVEMALPSCSSCFLLASSLLVTTLCLMKWPLGHGAWTELQIIGDTVESIFYPYLELTAVSAAQ